jgi:hypothetical protein
LNEIYKKKPVSIANRTKCFVTDQLRNSSIRAVKQRGTGISRAEEDGDIFDCTMEKLYAPPIPIVPYPHRSKQVTAWGFVREQPNLPRRWLSSIKERTEQVISVENMIKRSEELDVVADIRQEDFRIHGNPPAPALAKSKHA